MISPAFAHYLELEASETQHALAGELRERAREGVEGLPEARLHPLPAELDLVFSGGGFKNCYSAGVCLGLEALRDRFGAPAIVRFAGASAGAHMSSIALNDRYEEAFAWAHAVAETLRRFPLSRPWPMWTHFYTKMAHENPFPDPDRLHISVTRVSWFPRPRFDNEIVSRFHDADDLATALLASGSIPWVLCPGLVRPFRGAHYVDGGVTNNTPVFEDRHRAQLVVRFAGLPEPMRSKMVYFSWEQMLELFRLGLEDVLHLFDRAAGDGARRARCDHNLELIEPVARS